MARSKSDATKPVYMLDELAELFSARYHPHSGITMLVKNSSCLARIIHTLFTSKAAENNESKYCLYGNERRCAKCNYNNSGARSFLCCRSNELGNECGSSAFLASRRKIRDREGDDR